MSKADKLMKVIMGIRIEKCAYKHLGVTALEECPRCDGFPDSCISYTTLEHLREFQKDYQLNNRRYDDRTKK